ncbi:MAG: EAL domain-containing protein [Saccharospirillum sp.]
MLEKRQDSEPQPGCRHCQDKEALGFDFTFAFQPIFDLTSASVFSYEALVRGTEQQGAFYVLYKVNDSNRYQFDQQCRVKAVQLAAELGFDAHLNINFMPNAVYEPAACIRTTLNAASQYGFPTEKIIFELLESEEIADRDHLVRIVEHYQARGFGTAIDDFGAGYAGLGLLAEYTPDYLKLDMKLIRDIDQDCKKQIIVAGIVDVAKKLDIRTIAEGVETRAEADFLYRTGIELMQGYYFARPAFQALPEPEPGSLDGWR